MKADAATEAAVLEMYQRLMDAYANRDIDAFLDIFAPDPDTVLIGTGSDERRVGLDQIRAQAERDWEQSDKASFTLGWYTISASGPIAWTAADAVVRVFQGDLDLEFSIIFTGTLEQRGDRWYWVLLHIAQPSPVQAPGESWMQP